MMTLPTPTPARRRPATAALIVLALGLSACASSGDGSTSRLATLGGLITPYQIDVVQGNVITREQVEALQPGMSRLQVRDVLGTPLLQSVFHAHRWDYVFTFKRQGQPEQRRHLAVFFDGDNLGRFEADEMPTEAEFVASLDVRRRAGRTPALEATPEQIQAFRERHGRTATEPEPQPQPLGSYPPLEVIR